MAKEKLTPAEYQELKKFFAIFSKVVFEKNDNFSPETHPLAVLETTEKNSPKRAAEGLMMAINDCLEMASEWDKEKIAVWDMELKNEGIVTITELLWRYSSSYSRILKRGRISSEVEYYLLKNIAANSAFDMVPTEIEALDAILAAYEKTLAKTKIFTIHR